MDPIWEYGKVITCKGIQLRCLLLSEVPQSGGKLLMKAARCGWVDAGYPAPAAAYLEHLLHSKPNPDLWDPKVHYTTRDAKDVRMFVLEEEWQKVVPSENEFGVVSP
jgi:hypothetical protein